MAKKQKPTPEYDSDRETRVLLEQMNKSISLVAEQHGEIKADIGEIKSRLGNVESELDIVKMAVIENSREIKGLKADVVEIKADVVEIKADVAEIKIRQDRMEQKIDTALDNHEKRITHVEEKVGI